MARTLLLLKAQICYHSVTVHDVICVHSSVLADQAVICGAEDGCVPWTATRSTYRTHGEFCQVLFYGLGNNVMFGYLSQNTML